MNVRRWRLYVDESGDFGDRGARCAVLGLLVEEGAEGFERLRLERALREAAPGVPWPIHAWLTRRPAMYLLWPLFDAKRRGVAAPRSHVDARDAALGARPKARDAYERSMEALGRGAGPAARDLHVLRRALTAADRCGRYKRKRRKTRQALARVVRAAARRSPAFIAVFATAGHTVDERDVYVDALTGLFERVRDTLAALPGPHTVRAHVLGRGIVLGNGARAQLRAEHVRACAERAGAGSSRHVCIHAECVAVFDDQVHAALVIADHLANRARPLLRDTVDLRGLENDVRTTTELGLSLDALPLAASDGAPRALVARARDGELANVGRPRQLTEDDEPRRWAREQALVWVDHHLGEVSS